MKRGETSGRTDDNIESIKKRFSTFVQSTMPVVERFENENRLVRVSAARPVDDVTADLFAEFDRRLVA